MKEQKYLYFSIMMIVIAVILAFIIDIKAVLVILFLLLLAGGYITYGNKLGREIVIALLFALVDTAYYIYNYTSNNIMLGSINLFPLVSWTAGLVMLKEVHDRLKIENKFLVVCLGYWIGLFAVEYIGYYLLGIQLNGHNPDLLGMGIIHIPTITKFFYLFAGPVYLLVAKYLKIK